MVCFCRRPGCLRPAIINLFKLPIVDVREHFNCNEFRRLVCAGPRRHGLVYFFAGVDLCIRLIVRPMLTARYSVDVGRLYSISSELYGCNIPILGRFCWALRYQKAGLRDLCRAESCAIQTEGKITKNDKMAEDLSHNCFVLRF